MGRVFVEFDMSPRESPFFIFIVYAQKYCVFVYYHDIRAIIYLLVDMRHLYFLNHFAIGMRSGALRQMEEKVPATTPTSITSAKSRVVSAPK